MDTINAATTIANIIDFMDPSSASQFRRCERRIQSVMDSPVYWSSETRESPETCHPVEPYHVSSGLSKIILRSSYKEWMCVSCSSVSSIPVHTFYGTVVCRTCSSQNPYYRVTGLKAACKKFFVKPEDVTGIPKVEKSRGVFRVLEHQVRSCAERKHGSYVINTRIAKRSNRVDKIRSNRAWSYNRRHQLLTMHTKSALIRYRVRVDSHLMDTGVILKLAERHRLYNFIVRDILDFKVTSNYSVRLASENLFDLACFLSCCRREKVLMDDYVTACPHHDDFNASIVFMDHLSGDFHFYEYMSKYTKSIESLLVRRSSVLAHLASLGDSITREDRHEISDIVSAEEGIPLDMEAFNEFIEYGIGDPVIIARERRKIDFLRGWGYDGYFDYYHTVHGICAQVSASYARESALSSCRGLPIMNRRFTDSSISGLFC